MHEGGRYLEVVASLMQNIMQELEMGGMELITNHGYMKVSKLVGTLFQRYWLSFRHEEVVLHVSFW
jgi:hypothetical protein